MKTLLQIIKSEGFSIVDFANDLKVTTPTIYNWNKHPSTISMGWNKKLSKILGIKYTIWINSKIK